MESLIIQPEVQDALKGGVPVVLLETAVVTAGLPRDPWTWPGDELLAARACDWRPDEPTNLELARNMELAVRAAGAVPATVAIMEGRWRVGLSSEELLHLAADTSAKKASISSAASVLHAHATAGTTVSAVLVAAELIRRAGLPSPRVMATGGIGGVHYNWAARPDVSADLGVMARTPVVVVSAGVKSIVDVPATGEWLETLGVPILGLGTDVMPCFIAGLDPSAPPVQYVADVHAAAEVIGCHWTSVHPGGGVLIAVPVDPTLALPADVVLAANEQAEARTRGIIGPSRTPYLLEAMAQETNGASLVANVALLLRNATLATELALHLS